MRTTTQLLLVVLGVTLVAQLVFGLVAYWITSEADRNTAFRQIKHDAQHLASEIMASGSFEQFDPASLEHSLSHLVDESSAAVVAADTYRPLVTTGRLFEGTGLLKSITREVVATANNAGQMCDGSCYSWALVEMPEIGSSLIVVAPKNPDIITLQETLSMRLIASGLVILWIAIWSALVLSSTITKKLNAKNKALVYQALHDELTGLPNRNHLFDQVEQELANAEDSGQPFSVLLMDLDRFKEVNDTLGHHFGDLLLVEVANRLSRKVRKPATVARLGGDEFAVLVPGANHKKAIETAKAISNALLEPVPVDGIELETPMSIGIATYPADGQDTETLMQHADVAMYRAKRNMTKFMVYESEEDVNSIRRLRIMAELRTVIENEELDVHYQPKVCLETDRVVGVEALVRWLHPELGFVPPDEFIPLAEQTGLIHPLTDLVLEKAMKCCTELRAEGYDLTVAVNISTYALQDAGFSDELAVRILQSNLPASCLELEVTESAMMTDLSTATKVLERIVNLDVDLAIDDFGTGFSSLAYLKKLPVGQLKIDKSFVMEMGSDDNDKAIVKSIIDLAHHLGKKVVAEGVENQESLDFLRSEDCDTVQGYFISRPLPAAGLRDWLAESPWGRAARTLETKVVKLKPVAVAVS